MRLNALLSCILTISSLELVAVLPSLAQSTPASPQPASKSVPALPNPGASNPTQSTNQTTTEGSNSPEPSAKQSGSTALLAASTIITVAPQQGGMVQVKKGDGTPVNLVLAQPITDNSGQVVAFAGTPVMGTLKSTKGGAKIVVEKIVIDNRLVPLQASSAQPLAVESVPVDSFNAGPNPSVGIDQASYGLSRVANGFGGFGGYRVGNRISNVGGGIAALAGLAALGGPKKVKVVQLGGGQPHLMTLDNAVSIPIAQQQPPTPQPPAFPGQQQPFPVLPGQQDFPSQVPGQTYGAPGQTYGAPSPQQPYSIPGQATPFAPGQAYPTPGQYPAVPQF